ncbi:hypothetical protein [Bradyrhizobium sp. CCGE-LA001]|uniref:hypothetical protein n=1 Tax=Bradyrhizobium sp. CCGE-LA001 TaxID=1223566 RepID=UPI0002AA6804|nr:hypothetical protein [Bradyrhizobium sp. CCGE-LA001]AMA55039.1 hypothetical protein BCCGELA001_01300 [Bradyrhizobium sp. CCGE-LA001]
MPLRSNAEHPFAEVNFLGIVAKKVDPIYEGHEFGIHVGFLYQLEDNQPRVAHFAWHEIQRDDEPDDSYLWSEINLDESNRLVVASWLDDRRANPDLIPYGFRTDGSPYVEETSDFVAPPIGQGFTCATFIVGVLKHLGFPLLVEDSWPDAREDDILWQEGIVSKLEGWASPEHRGALRDDVGTKRFRPEEVGGAACRAPDWPVLFEDASVVAAEIIAELRNHVPEAEAPGQ